jgi:hypothetical protein
VIDRSLSQEVRTEIASALALLVSQHSPQLCEHCRRVAQWARMLGNALGGEYALDAAAVADLEIAGFLHDLGLVTIPGSVLTAGGIEAETTGGARQHVVSGYAVLSNIQSFERVAVGILHHHEQFDGRGFPHHLWRRAIPLFARILAVIDSYDLALHPGFTLAPANRDRAMRLLTERSGRGLDPGIVQQFLAIVHASEGDQATGEREMELPAQTLKPGMVLTRDLRSVANVMLLKAGTELTEALIDRILRHEAAENALTYAYVDRFSVGAPPTPPPTAAPEESRSILPATAPVVGAQDHRPQVLVVGARLATAHSLRAELEPMGLRVSGPMALDDAARFEEGAMGAAVVDLALGSGPAREAIERLAQNATHPHCVALASVRPDADPAAVVRDLPNVVAVVAAPWSRGALADAVREAIDRNFRHSNQPHES